MPFPRELSMPMQQGQLRRDDDSSEAFKWKPDNKSM